MALHIETIGPDDGPEPKASAVLAHGFTQNTRCWGRFGTALASALGALVAVDLPGHGRSKHDDADLPGAAALVSSAMAAAGGAGTWIGYSMGGRVLLHAALAQPGTVGRLVLIGATAGLISADERTERRAADARLADRLLAEGLDPFLEFWLGLPLFAGLSDEVSARSERMANRPEGLAASLRNCGTGTQVPLWDRLSELSMPVLIVVGERDEKFLTIGQEMTAAIGSNASMAVIDGAGHACHLEHPEATAEVIVRAAASPDRP